MTARGVGALTATAFRGVGGVEGAGGVGGSVPGYSAFAASFAMGDVRIFSLRLLVTESSAGLAGSQQLAGNIGNLLLEQFRVLFDYKNSRLVLYEGEQQGN